jgi:transcriptional regulator NrdR family protein
MNCPNCKGKTKVNKTIVMEKAVVRQRICSQCRIEFSTIERFTGSISEETVVPPTDKQQQNRPDPQPVKKEQPIRPVYKRSRFLDKIKV